MFLLESIFSYKLDLDKDIEENLNGFAKLVQDIKSIGDKHIDNYNATVLLI